LVDVGIEFIVSIRALAQLLVVISQRWRRFPALFGLEEANTYQSVPELTFAGCMPPACYVALVTSWKLRRASGNAGWLDEGVKNSTLAADGLPLQLKINFLFDP